MKKSLLLLCCLLLSGNAVSQTVKTDVIIKKDNTKIEVIIQEINNTTIKYTRLANPTRPVFTIEKSEVASILYANGEVESFENVPPNRANQLPSPAIPQNAFEESIHWASDSELKKMYVLEKSHIKNKIVSGSIFMVLSGIALTTTIVISTLDDPYSYSYSYPSYSYNDNRKKAIILGVLGTISFGVVGTVKFKTLGKPISRKKTIKQEFLRRNINPNSFSLKIQPSYDPLSHAPTLTFRAGF